MKIKNNTKNLIPRHLTGGLVRKYQLAAGSRGIERYKPTFTDRIVLMSRNTPQNRAVNRAIFAAKDNTGLPISTWPKYSSITNKTMSTWPDGETTMYINNNKDSIGLDGTIYNNSGKVIGNDGIITTASKPAQNKGTQGKPAGTKGNSSKGGTRGSKGNVRTTAKPAATTTTTTPTVTPASTENTGNYTIQRGDTLGALAKRFGMSVDELARLNNISNPNRIYAGRTLITKAPTVETPDIKIETPSVPNYGYGVTDSNLKLGTNLQYYPSYNLDELLRSAFSKFGLNFDDYKQLTADKLPTNVAPVSQEVKTFNPGNTVLTPSYKALRDARLEDEALKRSKLLSFAKQGTKLIRKK